MIGSRRVGIDIEQRNLQRGNHRVAISCTPTECTFEGVDTDSRRCRGHVAGDAIDESWIRRIGEHAPHHLLRGGGEVLLERRQNSCKATFVGPLERRLEAVDGNARGLAI